MSTPVRVCSTAHTNTSKLALLFLIDHLKARGLDFIDIQQLTPHMEALGAKEIPRDEFLDSVATNAGKTVWCCFPKVGIGVAT